jgi:hypothetical protein
MLVEQLLERGDDAPDRSRIAAWAAAGGGEYETVMGLAALVVFVGDDAEVGDVLRDDGALLGLGQREEVRVRWRAQFGALGHGIDVMSASTELLGDRARMHLVEHELHGSGERLSCALPRGELPFGLLAVAGDPLVDLLAEVGVIAQGHVDLRV